jgi:hypothetical protein
MKEEENQLAEKQIVWATVDNFSWFNKVIVPLPSII